MGKSGKSVKFSRYVGDEFAGDESESDEDEFVGDESVGAASACDEFATGAMTIVFDGGDGGS